MRGMMFNIMLVVALMGVSLLPALVATHEITLQNGTVLKGIVVRENGVGKVWFQTEGGTKYIFAPEEYSSLVVIKPSESLSKDRKTRVPMIGNVGLGVGVPYGAGIGFSGEYYLPANFSVIIGYGTVGVDDALDVGISFYFRRDRVHWRPRVMIYSGTNAVVIVKNRMDSNSIDEQKSRSFRGTTIGVGQEWVIGKSLRNGLTLDLMMIKNTDYEDYIDELKTEGYDVTKGGNVGFSLGYRYHF